MCVNMQFPRVSCKKAFASDLNAASIFYTLSFYATRLKEDKYKLMEP